jgi:hypothetical protein
MNCAGINEIAYRIRYIFGTPMKRELRTKKEVRPSYKRVITIIGFCPTFQPQRVFLNLETTTIKASYYCNENTKGRWRGHIAKEGLHYINKNSST